MIVPPSRVGHFCQHDLPPRITLWRWTIETRTREEENDPAVADVAAQPVGGALSGDGYSPGLNPRTLEVLELPVYLFVRPPGAHQKAGTLRQRQDIVDGSVAIEPALPGKRMRAEILLLVGAHA